MKMRLRSKSFVIIASLVGVTAPGCLVDQLDAVDDEGVGGSDSGVVVSVGGVGGGPQTAQVVSASSGSEVAEPCGIYEDIPQCNLDGAAVTSITLVDAETAIVNNWRRCNVADDGVFDVGVRFESDGRALRFYRNPPQSGSTLDQIYCGSDSSDIGSWTIIDETDQSPGRFAVHIAWDDGSSSTFELSFYEGLQRMGLFDATISTVPEQFEPLVKKLSN
jgi:hypothetical protein